MSTWIIISWVLVAILTAINIVVFLQLKKASEQMMKGMQGRGSSRGPGFPAGPAGRGGASDAQLKAAMDMLQQMQKGGGKKR